MNIVYSKLYKNFTVYDHKKAVYGFYEDILEDILTILRASTEIFTSPTAIHYSIYNPKFNDLKRITEILNRWQKKRDRINQRVSEKPLFFYTIEKRPRTGEVHAHLLVIGENTNFADAVSLIDMIRKLSHNNRCKLHRRRSANMQYVVDPETGEIVTNEDGEFATKGSKLFHRVRSEFHDCFHRFSYLAKVFTKSGNPIWSCSRVERRFKRPNCTIKECVDQEIVDTLDKTNGYIQDDISKYSVSNYCQSKLN